ncbi:MAG: hypothetical protein ACFCVB_05960 [Nodosilinea sp.]
MLLAAIALAAVVSSPGRAKAVESPDSQAGLLADIAFQYAELNDAERWSTVADQALRSTRAMDSQCFQANPLAKVAGSYLLIGQERQGQALLAEAITTAKRQAATGCSGSATSPTESLLNRAKEYAEAGYLDLAIEIGLTLGDPLTLAELAGHLSESGQSKRATELLDQAIALAQTIPITDIDYRTLTLVSMAERLRLTGQAKLARPVLDNALESITTQAPSSDAASMQILSRLRVATELTAIDAASEAIAVLDQTVSQIQTLSDQPYPLDSIVYQIDAALLYAQLGQPYQAETLLTNTFAMAEAMVDDSSRLRADALGRVAEAYARLDNLDRALQIAQAIQPGIAQEAVFQKLAISQSEAGYPESAVALAQSSGSRRNTTFTEITRRYLANQQTDQAWAFVQAEQVQGITAEVVLGFLESGQPDQAWQIVQASGLEGLDADTALAQTQAGQPDQAWQRLEGQTLDWLMPEIAGEFAQQRQLSSALQVAESIGDKTYQAQALMAIAQGYSPQPSAQQGFFRGAIANLADFVRGVFGDSHRETAIAALDRALEITLSP